MKILCTVVILCFITNCGYGFRGRSTRIDTHKGKLMQNEVELKPANTMTEEPENTHLNNAIDKISNTKSQDESKTQNDEQYEEAEYTEENDETSEYQQESESEYIEEDVEEYIEESS